MNSVCFNGKFLSADQPVLMADNRGYRYGDGLFETMKVFNGQILLEEFHFQRLLTGLELLKFEISSLFKADKIREEVIQLCKKNNCTELARVRLSVFRGNGGLYDGDKKSQYLIECWPLDKSNNDLNENGLVIDVFPDARKSCDVFSNLKSANCLPYVMAAEHAKENKLNDCLVLNQHERIADSTIANVFIIKGETIITPALSEGCVNGVMRRYLVDKVQGSGEKAQGKSFKVQEGRLTVEDVLDADEIFLTNAIKGIRWVKQFGNKTFTNSQTVNIYKQFLQTIYR
jgi:branched-chain amino acid aminotransferase